MANIQTGILPLAGRYGGGKIHMEKELNPIRNYQYPESVMFASGSYAP
jgi:hypothetical protein